MYYGSRLSENMIRGPDGSLICRNVPIGRTGVMEYYGEEIGIEEKRGVKLKVTRSPEELFSKVTIASFEGRTVTNEHPPGMLDTDSIAIYGKGHIQNVRPDGDFLLADLIITDTGLISEIENGKREVSSGYSCMWIQTDENEFEQKEIIGNHVAVVNQGRAGPKVAIKDSKPRERSKDMKKGIIGKVLKAFAKDADPEELEAAMDALNGEGGGEPAGNPDAPADGTKQIIEAIGKIGEKIDNLEARVGALEQSDQKVHKEIGAEDEFASFEKETSAGEGAGSEVVEEPAKDKELKEEPKEDPKPVGDAFYQGMKKAILKIPDEKLRNQLAKEFVAACKDSKGTSGKDGYSAIFNAVNGNKKNAMDKAAETKQTLEQRSQDAANAWNAAYKKEAK